MNGFTKVNKKIVYIDMDNVLVDFQSGIDQCTSEILSEYEGRLDEVPGIFSLMKPIPGAIESAELLSKKYDAYILSTAPWNNPTAWIDKVKWVQLYLNQSFHKKLIISHHKNLNQGDFLIDDRTKNGAGEFSGKLILFGSDEFPNWESVRKYLDI